MVAGGRLTDWISLCALTSWVPADAVDDASEAAGRTAQRRGGKLPPRVVAYVLAAMGPAGGGKGTGEQSLAQGLYPALEEDWLVIADRCFFSWDAWRAAADTGAALLWRVKSDLRLPVLELLPDGSYRSVLIRS